MQICRCSGAIRSASATASSSAPTEIIAPWSRQLCSGDVGARQRLQPPLDRVGDRPAEGGVVGDQDRLRVGVVLGLRHQVERDPVGVVVAVGDHQHLGGAGDHVDADLAEDLPLGRGDIGVAGAR